MGVASKIVTWGPLAALMVLGTFSPCRSQEPAESAVGWDAKPFTLDSVAGEPVSLSEFLGKKPILLVFISISCFECDDMMPIVSKLIDTHEKSGDLKVLFVALANRKGALWLSKSGKYDRRAPLLVEKVSGALLPTADDYGVVATPSLFLIGLNGKIQWSHTGRVTVETLEAELRKTLNRPR